MDITVDDVNFCDRLAYYAIKEVKLTTVNFFGANG